MSSLIVTTETINRAVQLIDNADDVQRPGTDTDRLQQIGEALQRCNIRAVRYRYADHDHDHGDSASRRFVLRFVGHGRPYTRAQMLKAAHCLRYQCEEGPSIERTAWRDCPEARLIDEAIGRAEWHYATKRPEYDEAPWGAEHRDDTDGADLLPHDADEYDPAAWAAADKRGPFHLIGSISLQLRGELDRGPEWISDDTRDMVARLASMLDDMGGGDR